MESMKVQHLAESLFANRIETLRMWRKFDCKVSCRVLSTLEQGGLAGDILDIILLDNLVLVTLGRGV